LKLCVISKKSLALKEALKMSNEYSEEIFREELPMFRSICLRVSPTGAVRIDAQDMGES
jgi:hypothetical protein